MPESSIAASPTGDKTQERSALLVATLTSFMGPLMVSAVNVALPSIQADLKVTALGLSWIATAYLLSVAIFLVPAGKVADIHGRKKTFATGLVIYTIASTLAAAAPSLMWLIAVRVLQGLGAAMFVTTGMAILTSIFPPARRGRAIGIYVSAVYVGLSAGPFVGGILTQHLGWRSVFMLILPLGAVSVGVTLRYLRGEWADARGERFDVAGSLLYGAAIFCLVYGATILPAAHGVYLLAAGVICMMLFIRHEQRIAHPVFEVTLFKVNRTFAFSSLAALINYAATFAVTFLISLHLQYLKGLSPQAAGTVLIAQPLVMALFSPSAGRLSDRIEPRIIASAGMGITLIGLTNFVFVQPKTQLILIVANLVLLGFGFALFSSPNMSAIMGSVEKKFYGIASGAVATMRLLGQMVSMAIATVVLALFVGRQPIEPATYALFLRSVKTCFAIGAMLCALGIFFSMFRGSLRR